MYLFNKFLIALFTVVMAVTITFVLIRNMPGDIIYSKAMEIVSSEGIPFDIAYERAEALYGAQLEGPLYLQYVRYMKDMMTGDLGESIFYKIPVIDIILKAVPWTAFVCSISIIISFFIGSRLGLLVATKRKGILNSLVNAYASVTDATPDFITALLLLIIFSVTLGWFPLKGAYDISVDPGFNIPFIISVLYHAILPIAAYTIENIGGWALVMKASAMDILGEDYLTAAKAKGLKERTIRKKYIRKNAILPPFTSLTIAFGAMIGGSALIESTFAYPGIGFYFTAAIGMRDYTLMQGLFLFTTVAMVIANLAADIIYYFLDPRVRG